MSINPVNSAGMFSVARELFSILSPLQRRQFYLLQLLVVLMAFAEIVGVMSIGPFMALVADPAVLTQDNLLADAYVWSGLDDPLDFLFYAGLAVLFLLALAALISMFTIWRLSVFSARIGAELADRLFAYYMQKDWLFHAGGSSAQLTKQIANEAVRVADFVITPLLQMNARLILALFICIAIFVYDPLVALAGVAFFGAMYVLLYRYVRERLNSNGRVLSEVATLRFRLLNEGLGGIKDVLLLGRKKDFIDRFRASGEAFAVSKGSNTALGLVPRYFMELLAFSAMIFLVLFLIRSGDSSLAAVLPSLAIYAFAGFKLLPALQMVYVSVAQIRGNIAAFEAIRDDLFESVAVSELPQPVEPELLPLKKGITLEQVTFVYPGKHEPALDAMELFIPVGSAVGLVGASGSGKSTVVDLLLGLISPQHGELRIDDTVVTSDNLRAWQNRIGFVAQSIFLSEGSIADNVAFGIARDQIDPVRVKKALAQAHLASYVDELPEGVDTLVGERGVQLSGGQRQRIGIARALYHDADVLVFDEATSALDGITERLVMDAIQEFRGQKTIIMIAHRLKTIENCNIIFMIEAGRVVDQGSYAELLEKNEHFRRMAVHA